MKLILRDISVTKIKTISIRQTELFHLKPHAAYYDYSIITNEMKVLKNSISKINHQEIKQISNFFGHLNSIEFIGFTHFLNFFSKRTEKAEAILSGKVPLIFDSEPKKETSLQSENTTSALPPGFIEISKNDQQKDSEIKLPQNINIKLIEKRLTRTITKNVLALIGKKEAEKNIIMGEL
jgi:hypothetical protein